MVFLHETWHTILFDIYYCVEIVIIEKNSHMFESTSNFVGWHDIWHTTLFSIHDCGEMIRIKKKSHMLEITSEVAFLRFLTHFWQFLV